MIFAEMPGAWLEPCIGSMWQEHTGVTPTTNAGQTIGLLLDRSMQQQLGPEINTSPATWIVQAGVTNAGNGVYIYNATASTSAYKVLTSTYAGTLLYVTFTVSNYMAGTITPVFRANLASARSGNGTYAAILTGLSGNADYTLYLVGNSTANYTISNVSIVQIFGSHAAQTTAANRPTLQYNNGLPFVRCDSNDFMTVSLPNLGGNVFSSAGSVYFALPTGMSAIHNQSIGTSYSAPIQSMDLYGAVIVPSRLSDQREAQLQTYFEKLAGLR